MYLRFFEDQFSGWIDTSKIVAIDTDNNVYIAGGQKFKLSSFEIEKIKKLEGIKDNQ